MMKKGLNPDELLSQLLNHPDEFAENGLGNELLNEFFRGYPLETLRSLLVNPSPVIQREAVWIVSELGYQGSDLIFDIIPFLNHAERAIRYAALESVMVFSAVANFEQFLNVVKALETSDEVIRMLAMGLVSNANDDQIRAALPLLSRSTVEPEKHKEGLTQMLGSSQLPDQKRILDMLNSRTPTTRKYGAILAKRALSVAPSFIRLAATNDDPDVKQFANDVIKVELS